MAPCSCCLIGWAAALIPGSDSLLLSSEEPSRVKTRQRGPTNYQLTPCFHPPLPLCELPTFLPLPHPYCSAAGWLLTTHRNSRWPNKLIPLGNILTIVYQSHLWGAGYYSCPCTRLWNKHQTVHQVQRVTESGSQHIGNCCCSLNNFSNITESNETSDSWKRQQTGLKAELYKEETMRIK